jgi:hypothetical protein
LEFFKRFLALFAVIKIKVKSFIILTPVGLDCEITGWGLINKTHRIIPSKLQVLQIITGDWHT